MLPVAPVAAQPADSAQVVADTVDVPTDLNAPLSLAPEVRTGTFDNGLRYYVRQNNEPADRLELRLVVDAGSILEDEDEEGIAHFLEHMLFNGTEKFGEDELVDVLERTGMRFGPDVNASTSFDRTLYTLTIPTDSAGLVTQGMDILQQWASAATLSPSAIDNERGVILSEWRQRSQNAQSRLQRQIQPVLFGGSRYAERLPIGDTSDVRSITPEQMESFYRTWYRPNLMAVVAVGDAAPDRIEAMIRERFASLQNPDDAPERPAFDVPPHDTTRYVVATDPEFPVSLVSVLFKEESASLETVGDYRRELVTQLFYRMLNQRLEEKARSGTAPFLGAGAFEGGAVRPTSLYGMQARVPDDSVTAGLEALLVEAERVRQHGFTSTELVRTKRALLTSYESAFAERGNQPSGRLANELVQFHLTGDAAPGIEVEYALAQRLLDEIEVDAVNARAARLFSEKNRTVAVQMPEKESVTPPSKAELAAALDRVREREVEPYTDDVTDVPLIAETPDPVDITERSRREDLDVTEMTLANGVRLIVKPTDFKADEVRVQASSPGGLSQVPDSAFALARHAASVASQSGAGTFTQTALEKKIAGKNVSLSPFVSETQEGMNGQASPDDLETLFQLMHLYATAPRVDSSALVRYQRQQRSYLQNRSRQPQAAFQDSITAALFGDHPRVQPPTIKEIDALNREALLDVYRDRFADLSDLTVTVVGTLDVDSVATLAQTYLGTLPGGGRTETVRETQPDLPDTTKTVTVRAGQGQRSVVSIIYNGGLTYDRETRHRLRTLQDVLNIKLREELREKRSGVYGVGVNASTNGEPYSNYRFSISFVTEPSRTDTLIRAARAEIDSVRAGGHVTEGDVTKVKEQQRRSRETSLEQNGSWVSLLHFAYTTDGEDPGDILTYETMIDAITPEEVTETARTYLRGDRWVEAVLYPDGFQQDGSSSP